jgi:hypothetical protein
MAHDTQKKPLPKAGFFYLSILVSRNNVCLGYKGAPFDPYSIGSLKRKDVVKLDEIWVGQ